MRTIALLPLMLLLTLLPLAAEDAADLMRLAEVQAQSGHHAAALELYQRVLKLEPDNAIALYDAGVAAILIEKYDLAVGVLEHLRQVQPRHWRGLEHLIQAYQGMGNQKAADAGVESLKALWKKARAAQSDPQSTDRIPDLAERKHLVRDIFTIPDGRVYVAEPYAPPTGDLQHIWDFVVVGPDDKLKFVYYVEYDVASTRLARELGNKNVELYFFDRDDPKGHMSFDQLDHRPTFPEALALMRKIMAGQIPARTRSTRP